jgi:hypothetical protein
LLYGFQGRRITEGLHIHDNFYKYCAHTPSNSVLIEVINWAKLRRMGKFSGPFALAAGSKNPKRQPQESLLGANVNNITPLDCSNAHQVHAFFESCSRVSALVV